MKPSLLFAKIFITGGAVLGLELVASRILTPFFGVSLYVWSAILSVTLIALALGYQGGGQLTQKISREKIRLLFAAAGGLAALWLCLCSWTYPFLFAPLSDTNLVVGSIAACFYLLFVPLVILSALNPMLVALVDQSGAGDHGAGRVFFISTIGSVAGVFATAYGLMPRLTNYEGVVFLALVLSLLSMTALLIMRDFKDREFKKFFALTFIAVVISALTFVSGGLERFARRLSHEGIEWRVVEAMPSYFGQVQIVDIGPAGVDPVRALFTDGLLQNQFFADGRSSTLYTYALEELGLGMAENFNRALVLGLGAGVIPRGYADAGLEVETVDIDPVVVKAAEQYLGFDPKGINIRYEDARTVVRHCSENHYDIVAVDLFRGDGIPEHLVTREFFSDIHRCMTKGGVMVMNTFMHVTNPAAEMALLRTITDVFGETVFLQRPTRDNPDFTVAFLVSRKGGEVGKLIFDHGSLPRKLQEDMETALNNARVLKKDDPALQDAPVLTDLSNQWKHLAWSSELAYRRGVVSKLPWQILMN